MTDIAEDRPRVRPDARATLESALARIPRRPVLLALIALVILVWLSQGMTFYHDEYTFILLRDLSVRGIFAPHNEHLSATLVILYRVLLGTVGMVSYWPYLGVTFALHLAVAGIVYVVVRREAPMAWALGAMAIMLVLGSGGDDILWAFQSGTIGATAFGMAALVDRAAPARGRGHPADDRAVDIGRRAGVLRRHRRPPAADPAAGAALAARAARLLPRLVRAVRHVVGLARAQRTRRVRARRPDRERRRRPRLDVARRRVAGAPRPCVRSRSRVGRPTGRAGDARRRASRSSSSPVSSARSSAPNRRPLRATSTSPRPAFLIAGAVLLARIPRPVGPAIGAVAAGVRAGRQPHPAGREPRPAAVQGRLRAGAHATPARQRRQSLLTPPARRRHGA